MWLCSSVCPRVTAQPPLQSCTTGCCPIIVRIPIITSFHGVMSWSQAQQQYLTGWGQVLLREAQLSDSAPCNRMHQVTMQTAYHCGLYPQSLKDDALPCHCPFSSQLMFECSCLSPELNGTEATCLFQACGPRVCRHEGWTWVDRGTFSRVTIICGGARSASKKLWDS